jgi:hypothetical protein
MMKIYAAWLGLCVASASGACKSEADKQEEAARTQLELAKQQAALAQAQLAKAEQQMAESAARLGKEGGALGAQGAALGVQAATAGIQAATAAMNSVAGSLAGGGAKAALVDFRALKALLPEAIGGLKRVSASGEKNAALGMGASHAEGRYEGDGGARLKVKIVDLAAMGALAAAGMGLAAVEVDKETDHGYERTTMLGGNKALEKYDSRSREGEVQVSVGGRFMVEIDGHNVPMEAVKDALSKIDLAKLQALGAAAR